MASIEDILAYKAIQRAQDKADTLGPAIGVGATSGSILGAIAGRGTRGRMAGALVGAIVGGGLGSGIQQQAMKENPAAELLAKLQVRGGLSASEMDDLQQMIAQEYSKGIS